MPTETRAPPRAHVGYYEFGPYRLEVASRTLFRGGEFVALTPKVAETLLALVEVEGLIVTKEQLLERVWPGVVVEEGGIANVISALRKVLKADFGEDGGITTVSRQGYRFTEGVQRDATAPEATLPPTHGLQARSSVLVGDIENKTGDPVFDGTIRQALALVLAQSAHLEVLSDRRVHAALAVMQRQGAPVLGEVALEVCQRTNTKAAITGSIFALGDDYVIGLYAIRGDTGDTLLSEQARAHGKGEVLQALDHAALGLRAKLGESLASITRYSSGLAEVATASLEALKAYSTLTLMALGRVDEAQALVDEMFALKYDSHIHHANAYLLAFLRGDAAAMQRHVDAVMGRENEEEYLIVAAAHTEAFHGRHDRARELSARAAALALRGGSTEMAATWMAEAALRELYAGFVDHAHERADAALATGTGRNVLSLAALVFARSGREADAERLAAELDRTYPQYTLVQRYWLPSIRGALALARKDWRGAVSVLEAATPMELGTEEPFANAPVIPPYLRGLAYLEGKQWADAAREFAKITSRPTLVRSYLVLPLARAAEATARAEMTPTSARTSPR